MRQLWLFFKQGTKSIFKQKMQFFVLIILSFLAVFYLVTSAAITTRMNKIYDDVLKNYEKFDYTYSKKADESNLIDKNDTYLPILDFLNKDINYVKNNDAYEFESFNVVYNNEMYKNDSFITKAFFKDRKPTEKLQKIWKSKLNGKLSNSWSNIWYPLSRWEFNNQGKSRFLATQMEMDFKNGIPGLAAETPNWWGEGNNESITYFANEMTMLLAKSLWDELNEFKKSSIRNEDITLFERYFLNNDLSLETDFKDPTNNEGIEVKNIANTTIEVYIYNALESISFEILNSLIEFVNNSNSRVFGNEALEIKPWEVKYENIEDAKEGYKKFIVDFNCLAEELGGTKIVSYSVQDLVDSEGYDETAANYNMNVAFAYIFGVFLDSEFKVNVENSKVNNYLNTNGKKYVWKDDLNTIQKDLIGGDTNIIIKEDETDYGKRGLANPITTNYNSELKIVNGFYSKNDYLAFEKLSAGTTIASEFNGKYSNKNNYSYDNKSIYSMNILHQEIAANESGFDLLSREEAYYYDRVQRWNFRFIIVDDAKEFNFTLTAGLEAVTANEVVISQQFAMRNDIKVGDKLKIGNSNFVVSGFGVDVLTYYPLGDPEIPVSDTASNALVYIPKNVINNIMESGIANETIFSTLYFLKEKPKNKVTSEIASELTLKEKIVLYDSLIGLNKNKLQTAQRNVIEKNFQGGLINRSIKNFNTSNHALSWDLQPEILKVIKLFSLVASLVIIFMVLLTLTFTIKKIIDRNSSQIGYLKAMGVNSKSIAVSYLGYAIIIGLIVVPLAWIAAGLFQEVISRLFSVYLATTMYEFIFDWRLLALVILIFEIIAVASSYFISIWLTRKPALKIINHDSGSSNKEYKTYSKKQGWFSKLSFKYKFPIKISLRGWKQIAATSIAVLVSTFIITFAATLPATLNIYVSDSTKNMDYKNKYISTDRITNLPTSRTSISPTLGIPELETRYSEPGSLEELTSIYFDKSQLYGDSNWDTAMFPKITLDKNKNAEWFEQAVLRPVQTSRSNYGKGNDDSQGVGSNLLASILLGAVGKTTNLNGFSFSTGTFESFISYLWNSNIDPTTGLKIKDLTNQQILSEKTKWFKDASVLLNKVIPNLLEMFKGKLEEITGGEITPGKNWKQDLLLLASSFLPSSSMQYLNDSPNRLSQFIIGLNVENYAPGEETLATEAQVKINNKNIKITGLKNGQTVFNLNPNVNDSLYISDNNSLKKLNELFKEKKADFKEDIFLPNGFKIFDASTRVLNIPVVTNKKYKTTMELDGASESINSINNTVIKLNNHDGAVIPSGAWIYDNRIVSKSPKVIDQLKAINGNEVMPHLTKDWINVETIPTNRMTLQNLYNIDNPEGPELTGASTSMFIDTWLDNAKSKSALELSDENIQYAIRPEYQMSNIKLFVPKSVLDEDITTYLQKDRFASLTKLKNYDSQEEKDYLDVFKESAWAGKISATAAKTMIPDVVKQSWANQYNDEDDWMWIAPYHPASHLGSDSKNGVVSDIGEVSNAMPWLARAMGRASAPLSISNTGEIPSFLNDIKVQSVGTIDTYNGDIFIADQDIINLLLGMSTEKYIPANYDFYGDIEKTLISGSGKDAVAINMYQTRTPKEQLDFIRETKSYYMKDYFSNKLEDPLMHVAQNRDYTVKYSRFNEAYGITGGFKAINSETPGILNPEDFQNTNILYKDVNFVGHTLGMVVTVAETILLIAVFLIVGILMIVALIISILSDIFVTKYTKFIVTMRSMGYSKKTIIIDTMLVAGIFNIVMISIGFFLGIYFLSFLLHTLQVADIFIPLAMYWWLPIVILIGITIIIGISSAFSLRKTFKIKLITLT